MSTSDPSVPARAPSGLETLREALAALRNRIVAREQQTPEHREFEPLIGLADECKLLAAGAGGVEIGAKRPVTWLRAFALVATLVAGAAGVALAVIVVVFSIHIFSSSGDQAATEKLPALQAAVGLIIVLMGAVVSLWAFERRTQRKGLLGTLHDIRALAHRIDLLQLSKPTEHYVVQGPSTDASPSQVMSDFEFSRFLIYCRALLSWLGKIAALHARRIEDPVVLSAVDDVDALTARLQQNIGQRLLLLRAMLGARDTDPEVDPKK